MATNDLTAPPVDLWGRATKWNESWVWPEVGMRDKWHMSSASEVGTDDGTATTKNPKDPIFCVK